MTEIAMLITLLSKSFGILVCLFVVVDSFVEKKYIRTVSFLHIWFKQVYGFFGQFMKKNAYVPEGRNEGRRVATPTSFSIIDS